jgi:hypothetical protein
MNSFVKPIPPRPALLPGPSPRGTEAPAGRDPAGGTPRTGAPGAPTLRFVRAERDSRGRWLGYRHTATGGRAPLTHDGFLLESGCGCLPGDTFLSLAELEALLKAAKRGRRSPRPRPVR